jgi:hypothetical protein
MSAMPAFGCGFAALCLGVRFLCAFAWGPGVAGRVRAPARPEPSALSRRPKPPNAFAPGQIRATVGALRTTRNGQGFH